METLLNIILGLIFLLFVATAITLVGGWLILQTFNKQDEYKEKQSGKNVEPREENDPNPNQK